MFRTIHKLFLSNQQRKILNFVEKHCDDIHYTMWEDPGKAIFHQTYIEAEGMSLITTLQRVIAYKPLYSVKSDRITLSFNCNEKCNQKDCMFNHAPLIINAICDSGKQSRFPLAIYNKMVNYHIAKNGVSNQR